MKFRKPLARFYHQWYRNCHDSAIYCRERDDETGERGWLRDAEKYFELIINNWDAIEFFSIGDNAFVIDEILPEEFRGYE